MTKPPFDLKKAHHWFAVELNNLAWELVEADARSDDEVERMIHAAHGACFHWLEVGDLLNHLRAQSLLATAYFTAGHAEAAVRHAAKCVALSEEAGDSQTAFDRACTHGCAAVAFALAGDLATAKSHRDAMREAIPSLEHSDDAPLIDKLFGNPLASLLP